MEHLIKQAATSLLENGAKDMSVLSKYYQINLEVFNHLITIRFTFQRVYSSYFYFKSSLKDVKRRILLRIMEFLFEFKSRNR